MNNDHTDQAVTILILIAIATALALVLTGCASYTETMPDGTRRALHIVGTGNRVGKIGDAAWSHSQIPQTLTSAGKAAGAGARAAAGVP